MDSRRQSALVVLVVGALLLLVSALAEPLGIGAGGGVGWKQVVGMIVGALGLAVGVLMLIQAQRTEPRDLQVAREERPPPT
jgi:hypothetical protein